MSQRVYNLIILDESGSMSIIENAVLLAHFRRDQNLREIA